MKIRVIVNPTAGAGAAGRRIPEIERALRGGGISYELSPTSTPGDATRIARQARADGVEIIAVVGGDGTLNEVVQAFLDAEGRALPGPTLALIPSGTGGDFRRTLGLPKAPAAAVERLITGTARTCDLAVAEFTSDRGDRNRRAFVNIGSFGVSGRIDRLVNRSPKWIGGRAAFALGTVRAMSTYRNAAVSIHVDGAPFYDGRLVVAAAANGRYFGGGMQVAPEADPTDGLLDVVVIGDLGFADALRLSPGLYAGTHLGREGVLTTRGKLVEAAPQGTTPVFIDLDGEAPGRLPLTVRVLPGALRFVS